MAGNSAGAKKGAQTKKEKYGPDFHSRAGSMGARLGTPGYFGKLLLMSVLRYLVVVHHTLLWVDMFISVKTPLTGSLNTP